jgi:hypothetical protein
MAGSRGDGEELLEVLAGDQAPSADLEELEVPLPHLVIQQVAGQAGQAGGLVDGVRQPLGRQARFRLVRSGPGGGRDWWRCAWPGVLTRVPCAHSAASGSAGRTLFSASVRPGRVAARARASGAVMERAPGRLYRLRRGAYPVRL